MSAIWAHRLGVLDQRRPATESALVGARRDECRLGHPAGEEVAAPRSPRRSRSPRARRRSRSGSARPRAPPRRPRAPAATASVPSPTLTITSRAPTRAGGEHRAVEHEVGQPGRAAAGPWPQAGSVSEPLTTTVAAPRRSATERSLVAVGKSAPPRPRSPLRSISSISSASGHPRQRAVDGAMVGQGHRRSRRAEALEQPRQTGRTGGRRGRRCSSQTAQAEARTRPVTAPVLWSMVRRTSRVSAAPPPVTRATKSEPCSELIVPGQHRPVRAAEQQVDLAAGHRQPAARDRGPGQADPQPAAHRADEMQVEVDEAATGHLALGHPARQRGRERARRARRRAPTPVAGAAEPTRTGAACTSSARRACRPSWPIPSAGGRSA